MTARGVDGGLMRFHGSFGVGLWKNIKRDYGEFSSHVRFEVR
jgi:hypothetical protein